MTTLDSKKEEEKKGIDLKYTPINTNNEDSLIEEFFAKKLERAKAYIAKYGLPDFKLPMAIMPE
jgi:hypothetical protein